MTLRIFPLRSGARLLVTPGADEDEVRALLLSAALQFVKDAGVSSLHGLFLNEAAAREAQGMMLRQDVQFHWRNPVNSQKGGYKDFVGFSRRAEPRQA